MSVLLSNDATVPINCHLSDAAHGLQIAIQQRGPVHFNIQFRENLAPDGENEPIRGDPRERKPHKFDCHRYTDVVGWDAWTRGGQPWFLKYGSSSIPDHRAVKTLIHLLQQSSRAILTVGNIRPTVVSSASEEELGFEDATERATPTMTTDFVFDCPISSILCAVLQYKMTDEVQLASDELAPLIMLGRSLQSKLPKIILSSSASVEGQSTLTEPQIMLAIAQLSADKSPSYFWSNSMPFRDAETFFYPLRIRYFGKKREVR